MAVLPTTKHDQTREVQKDEKLVQTSSTASMSSTQDSTIGRFVSTGRSGVHCPELRAERSF